MARLYRVSAVVNRQSKKVGAQTKIMERVDGVISDFARCLEVRQQFIDAGLFPGKIRRFKTGVRPR